MTLLVAAVSVSVLVYRLPSVDYSTRDLGPKENEAMEALMEIQREIGGFDDALWLIVDGADEGEVADRLEVAGRELAEVGARKAFLPGTGSPMPSGHDPMCSRRTGKRLSGSRVVCLPRGRRHLPPDSQRSPCN